MSDFVINKSIISVHVWHNRRLNLYQKKNTWLKVLENIIFIIIIIIIIIII